MKLSHGMVIIFLFINGVLFAQSPENSEMEKTLDEANNFYREAMEWSVKDNAKAKKLFEKAAVYYEKIITDEKINNGKLYYNLGNTYFKMGDIGRAILNYRKAQQYTPDDKNLIQNLNFARSKRIDTITDQQEAMGWKIFLFFYYYIPTLTRFIIFIAFFVIIWILAILKLFFKQGLLNFFLTISIIITLIFSVSLIVEVSVKAKEKPGVIIANEVVARKGDNDITYEKSFQEPLHAGTEFTLIEERRNWYNIELKDGRTCWIQAKDAGLVK